MGEQTPFDLTVRRETVRAVRRCECEDTQRQRVLVCETLYLWVVSEPLACGSREPPKPADGCSHRAGFLFFGVALAAAARRFEGEILKKIKKFSKKCVKTLDRFSRKCYNIGVERMEVQENEKIHCKIRKQCKPCN
jgi:hypothetical protein